MRKTKNKLYTAIKGEGRGHGLSRGQTESQKTERSDYCSTDKGLAFKLREREREGERERERE